MTLHGDADASRVSLMLTMQAVHREVRLHSITTTICYAGALL